MSNTSQGEGWWQASDGKWYPPHLKPEPVLPLPPQAEVPSDPEAAPIKVPSAVAASEPIATVPNAQAHTPTLPSTTLRRWNRSKALWAGAAVAALAVAGAGVVITACGSSTAAPPPTTTASVASQWDSGVLVLETGTAAVSSGFQEVSNSAIKAGCQQILNEVQTLRPMPAPPGLSFGGYQELKTALSYFKTGGNQCITGISLGGLLNPVTDTGGGGIGSIALAGESFNSGMMTILTQTDSELSSVWSTAAGHSPVLYPTTTTTTTPPPTTTTAASDSQSIEPPFPPGGVGEPWQPAPPSLVSAVAESGDSTGSLWMAQDPNSAAWYEVVDVTEQPGGTEVVGNLVNHVNGQWVGANNLGVTGWTCGKPSNVVSDFGLPHHMVDCG